MAIMDPHQKPWTDPLEKDYPGPSNPELTVAVDLTADQEIRASALEAACRLHSTGDNDKETPRPNFWRIAKEFEAYIRDGR